MTSPADPNAALLAQLQSAADSAGMLSNDQVMAFLSADPEPDPLAEVDYTGDLEADSRAELDELHRGFRERAAKEDERFRLATDSEFWFCVCFKSREDKDAFLAAAGLVVIGDKYLDGYATARTLNVPMPDTEGR
ncbi:hypothetical protein GCM10029964_014710 [Kibdelosporangium lantanae]